MMIGSPETATPFLSFLRRVCVCTFDVEPLESRIAPLKSLSASPPAFLLHGENPRECSGERFQSSSWGLPECAPGSAPESIQETRSAPGSGVPAKCILRSTPWHSQFREHSPELSPGHSLGVPKQHSENTRRSTVRNFR